MKKLIITAILLGAINVLAQEKQWQNLKCQDELYLAFNSEAPSNSVRFADDDAANIKTLLKESEGNLDVKNLTMSANIPAGACVAYADGDTIAQCEAAVVGLPAAMRLTYVNGDGNSGVLTRQLTIQNLKLQVSKDVEEHHGSFPTKDIYVKVDLVMDAVVSGNQVHYVLSRRVGRLESWANSCKFSEE